MKKLLILIICLSLTVVLSASTPIALTLKVKHDVVLRRTEDKIDLETGKELISKDVLESGEDSYAAVKFVDGSSVVKLFPNSILKISADKKGDKLDKNNYLELGNLWSKVMKKTGTFEVETPTTVVSVKGTEFLLQVEETGLTNVFTVSGEVMMRNKKDDAEVTVKSGENGTNDGENPMQVHKTEEEKLDDETNKIIEEESAEEAEVLEIELKNDEGEMRRVKIIFK